MSLPGSACLAHALWLARASLCPGHVCVARRCNQLTGASVQLLTKLRRLSNLSVANCRNVNEAAIASLSTLHTLASIEF